MSLQQASRAVLLGFWLVSISAQAQVVPMISSGGDVPAVSSSGVPAAVEWNSAAGAGVPSRITNMPGTVPVSLGAGMTVEPPVSQSFGIPARPELPNKFQKFVLEATGKLLPIYGAKFFESSGVYAPQVGTPVPADYPLGPGDEVVIHGAGSVDVDYRSVIDRNGQINVPKVGTITLAGVRAADAEGVVRAAFGKIFRGVTLNVTLGQLRGMTIYVVGQAKHPGSYVVPSTSTAVSALFESGGPSANGSLRHIQVKRGGRLVAELDLYAFLAHGDKSSDVRLLDGDALVIPPAYGFVALTGEVETPAIYELHGSDDTVESILNVAGGLPVVADPRRALLERIDPERRQPRSVDEFALDGAGLSKTLRGGDLLTVLAIKPEFSNAVVLQGSVFQALRLPYRPGMKVTDLIPSKSFLLSRASLRRQNDSMILHDRQDEASAREQFPFEQETLKKAERRTERRGQFPNQPLETDPIEKSRSDQLERAKTAQEKRTFVDSIGNSFDTINWDYAVVERINRNEFKESLIPFNLGRALADPQGPDNIVLQPGDKVSVFSAKDVHLPIAKHQVFVRIEGEVARPGVYQAEPGESLVNLVEKAGGPTQDAYLFGSEFYRESVRRAQQANLDKFIRRVEQQGLSDAARLAANTSTSDPQAATLVQARLSAETDSRNRFLQRLRELKSTGRITLGLPAHDPNLAQIPNFRLENGDRLIVPTRPDFVQVVGAVNTEAALLWQPGRSVSDYLAQAGVTKDSDKNETFLIRADGAIASNTDRWFSSVAGLEVMPGDVIVVPEQLDKETFWTTFVKNTKDITQIIANFGLGAAAVHTLGK